MLRMRGRDTHTQRQTETEREGAGLQRRPVLNSSKTIADFKLINTQQTKKNQITSSLFPVSSQQDTPTQKEKNEKLMSLG